MAHDWSTSPSPRPSRQAATHRVSGVDLHLELQPGELRREGLERALREAIRSGRLAAGSVLPATRVLAAELGYARGTVSAAYDQLVAEGYLLARHGSGTSVAPVPAASPKAASRPVPKPRHDLRPGVPDVSTFPVEPWLRSARRALTSAPSSAFGYADDVRGRPELRAALADYLGRVRGVAATPDRIVVTGGYIQALSVLARVLGPTRFAMEDPGLPYHRELVTHAGSAVLPLPVDELGASPDGLGADARVVVVTPAHQFPTGVTLHPTRRRALIEWARATGGVIVEDDYDGEFRYDRQPVGALQGMAPDQVVYAGTAAKSLAPGVRLGWLVLPAELVDPVLDEYWRGGVEVPSLGQLTLADLILTHGYDRQIRAGRARYRRRRDQLIAVLSRFDGLRATGVSAGQHIMVTLPADGPDEAEILERARRRGLALTGLGGHWHQPTDEHARGLIIGYGAPSDAGFQRALPVLLDVLREAYR
jgi:GntR family transcriptional regulator/MocR family aminotransferase